MGASKAKLLGGIADALAILAMIYGGVFLVLKWVDRFTAGFFDVENWRYGGLGIWRLLFSLAGLYAIGWMRWRANPEFVAKSGKLKPGVWLVILYFGIGLVLSVGNILGWDVK